MLMLWMMAAALWAGAACSASRPRRCRPSFWSNALITMLILLGPAIEDSAIGKSVLEGVRRAHRPVRARRALRVGNGLAARALATASAHRDLGPAHCMTEETT